MTVRGANYKRRKLDSYPTPPEVVVTLFKHVKIGPTIFDPACGKQNRIVAVALNLGKRAYGRDITTGQDFLTYKYSLGPDINIVTNPPFGTQGRLAVRFIERALVLTKPHARMVAMLLPMDFDSAKTRQHIFGGNPAFAQKLVLLDRIKWFKDKSGATNFAWYIWSWRYKGSPTISYARIG